MVKYPPKNYKLTATAAAKTTGSSLSASDIDDLLKACQAAFAGSETIPSTKTTGESSLHGFPFMQPQLQGISGGTHLPAGLFFSLNPSAFPFNRQTNALTEEQRKRIADKRSITKTARINRRMVRQKTRGSSSSSSGSGSGSGSGANSRLRVGNGAGAGARHGRMSTAQGDKKRVLIMAGAGAASARMRKHRAKHLYNFRTPDNKWLRVLLRKELKNSDVGILGRIILPKREVEENFPVLHDKEGMQFTVRDVYSKQLWALRYKFWLNNKSRMYVLENTGDFIKDNELKNGDAITFYEDEFNSHYVSIKRAEVPIYHVPQQQLHRTNETKTEDEIVWDEEDEASLAYLIERFRNSQQANIMNNYNNPVTLTLDGGGSSSSSSSSAKVNEEAALFGSSSSNNNVNVNLGGGEETAVYKSPAQPSGVVLEPELSPPFPDLDDLFGGLGRLYDVGEYNQYFDYSTMFDDLMMSGDDDDKKKKKKKNC
ncbi:hypothetical protein UlMin_018419 [Ulmus minor]